MILSWWTREDLEAHLALGSLVTGDHLRRALELLAEKTDRALLAAEESKDEAEERAEAERQARDYAEERAEEFRALALALGGRRLTGCRWGEIPGGFGWIHANGWIRPVPVSSGLSWRVSLAGEAEGPESDLLSALACLDAPPSVGAGRRPRGGTVRTVVMRS